MIGPKKYIFAGFILALAGLVFFASWSRPRDPFFVATATWTPDKTSVVVPIPSHRIHHTYYIQIVSSDRNDFDQFFGSKKLLRDSFRAFLVSSLEQKPIKLTFILRGDSNELVASAKGRESIVQIAEFSGEEALNVHKVKEIRLELVDAARLTSNVEIRVTHGDFQIGFIDLIRLFLAK